jgi:hypothetical protein
VVPLAGGSRIQSPAVMLRPQFKPQLVNTAAFGAWTVWGIAVRLMPCRRPTSRVEHALANIRHYMHSACKIPNAVLRAYN